MHLSYEGRLSENEILETISHLKNTKHTPSVQTEDILFFKGDNLEVCSSLLKTHKNKIDLIYIDPPYNTGISFYHSEDKISTVSPTTNSKIAYEDSMKLDDCLNFIKERLTVLRELLSERGTIYLHIDIKMCHYIRLLMDEVFGYKNFLNQIARQKCNPKNFKQKSFGSIHDIVLIYAKEKGKQIFNDKKEQMSEVAISKIYNKVDEQGRRYTTVSLTAPGETKNGETSSPFLGVLPPKGRHWAYPVSKLNELEQAGKIVWSKNRVPRLIRYASGSGEKKMQDIWDNYKDKNPIHYPTEKNLEMLETIVLQSSLENSIILDCFAGSCNFIRAGLKHNKKVIGVDIGEKSETIAIQTLKS